MGTWNTCIASMALGIALSGCTEEKIDHPTEHRHEAPPHSDEPPHEELPRRVRLEPKVVEDARIEVAPVTRQTLSRTLSLPGEIAADPDRSAKVSTPVAGRIEKVSFREGSPVKKGDAVAVLRIPELGKIQGAFVAASAKAKAARTNAERLQTLAEKGLALGQEALSAKAEADALEAEANALGQQIAALGVGSGTGSLLTLRAPVSGMVIGRDAVVGQPVGAEQTIASIADMSEVWFLARVFERDLGKLREGAKAEVELNAYPAEHFQGVVEYVGRQIDPAARTVVARIRLTNRDDRLRIGLFGTGRVEMAEHREPALVVPRSALTEVAGKPVVFVRHADGDFELHDVVLGEDSVGSVEVISGLREGEQVVVAGVFTLKSAVLKSTLAEEH